MEDNNNSITFSENNIDIEDDVSTEVEDLMTKKRKRCMQMPEEYPKRPLSAYNIFFKETRERILKQNGKTKDQDMVRKIAALWTEITPKDKGNFDALASKDLIRYNEEVGIYECEMIEQSTIENDVQPEWVQNGLIVDTIVSFLPLELQAGDLRLVCDQFNISSMNQIESKLFKTKVIGYTFDGSGCMKVQVRRGWSEDSFCDSKDTVIEGAFGLAACHCNFGCTCGKRNNNNDSTQKQVVTFEVSKDKTATSLDLDQARILLQAKGYVRLVGNIPENQDSLWNIKEKADQHIHIEFEEKKENSIFSICDELYAIIDGDSKYDESYYDHLFPVQSCLKRDYGIVLDISNKQFLRSLFLVFNRDKDNHETGTVEEGIWYPDELQQQAILTKFDADMSETDGGSSSKNKIRCRTPSFAKAVTIIDVKSEHDRSSLDRYCRMKCIIRFRASSGKPIEILAETNYSIY